ncbi:glycosyltransferase 87 family protein [Gordonia sp. CPCC 205333]|uniref:glycosyltransferase 87 family protein n=1 Tax=Gordonia sp. CPCC 205333 TaxID=3140790 RepID=UPI003AF3C820
MTSTVSVVGFVFVGALAWWLQDVIVPFSKPLWGLFDYQLDLDVYRAGARTVLNGGNLYDAKLLGQMDYTYAPISMVVFIPFAMMSFDVARVVWSVGILIALYLIIMVSFKSLGHQVNWRLRVVAISLVSVMLLLEPVRTTVWYGQINVFLILLILLDLLRRMPVHREDSASGTRSEPRLAGVATGLAAGIKLTPLIFVFYLVLLRRWRAAFGVVGGFAGTIAVGFVIFPAESWKFWTQTMFDSNRVGMPQTTGNQSARGALANLIGTDSPNVLLWLGTVLAALALGMCAAVLAHRRGQELLALSLVGMTSCVVSPMSWGHHWVWFVPLVVLGIHLVLDSGRSWPMRVVTAVGLAAGFLATFAWREHFAFSMWLVNQAVPEAFLTGLFFKNGIVWLRWFTVDPYNWVFIAVAVATIVVCRGPLSSFDSKLTKGRELTVLE